MAYKDDLIIGMNKGLQMASSILNYLLKRIARNAYPLLIPGVAPVTTIQPDQVASLVVYNPLGWSRSSVVSIPINQNNLIVLDSNLTLVTSSILPSVGGNQTTKWTLFFVATNIPPLGYQTYFITTNQVARVVSGQHVSPDRAHVKSVPDQKQDTVIENSFLKVTISSETGRISSVQNKPSGFVLDVDQGIFSYTSATSGAYVFDPLSNAVPLSNPVNVAYSSQVVSQVWQTFGPYGKQSVRLYHSPTNDPLVENFLEIGFDVGPLPSQTEIITRFSTGIDSVNFFTDSNGFQYQSRMYDWTKPVQSNYYPFVYSSFITDSLAQLSVVGERSHGVSSLQPGQLEVMIHRNPDRGDGFGPSLTDTTEVYPLIRTMVDTPQASPSLRKKQIYLLNYPVTLFSSILVTSPGVWLQNYFPSNSLISGTLPPNVHLQGLNALGESSNQIIFRLVHIFEVGEDPQYSVPAVVDLTQLFALYSIHSLVETTISANAVINSKPGTVIVMQPGEIRTFLVNLQTV
eukprot:TRINITY_DN5533_c0_g1_i6.p2 TRINITY_DN5533_c0_g1~~TRINITY_DN5533_c0_g1_i6.p2  ORF type:complete len:516 (-),score=105.69 TRINITY_DN5533_c0_g1_i6:198-1745(-)